MPSRIQVIKVVGIFKLIQLEIASWLAVLFYLRIGYTFNTSVNKVGSEYREELKSIYEERIGK